MSKLFAAAILLGTVSASPLLAGAAFAEPLRIAMATRLGVLDPVASSSHQTRNHGYLIYDTLFSIDGDLQAQNQMVESWEVSDDGREYTFRLRDSFFFMTLAR